jgi:hypothetical protein
MISGFSDAPSQNALQNLLSLLFLHAHDGCAHFSLESAILSSRSLYLVQVQTLFLAASIFFCLRGNRAFFFAGDFFARFATGAGAFSWGITDFASAASFPAAPPIAIAVSFSTPLGACCSMQRLKQSNRHEGILRRRVNLSS